MSTILDGIPQYMQRKARTFLGATASEEELSTFILNNTDQPTTFWLSAAALAELEEIQSQSSEKKKKVEIDAQVLPLRRKRKTAKELWSILRRSVRTAGMFNLFARERRLLLVEKSLKKANNHSTMSAFLFSHHEAAPRLMSLREETCKHMDELIESSGRSLESYIQVGDVVDCDMRQALNTSIRNGSNERNGGFGFGGSSSRDTAHRRTASVLFKEKKLIQAPLWMRACVASITREMNTIVEIKFEFNVTEVLSEQAMDPTILSSYLSYKDLKQALRSLGHSTGNDRRRRGEFFFLFELCVFAFVFFLYFFIFLFFLLFF